MMELTFATITPLIGLLAGFLTTIAFVPQVIHLWRKRSAQDISWGMFILFTMGVALWLAYGILLQAMPVIVANAVTLVLAITILSLKWWFGKHTPKTKSE